MKKTTKNITIIFLISFLSICLPSCKSNTNKQTLKQSILVNCDSLYNNADAFLKAAETEDSQQKLQEKLAHSRLTYKKIEWAIEYFLPEQARFMNGPALDELELEENRQFPPHGYQVIEEALSTPLTQETKKVIIRELKSLKSNALIVRKHFEALPFSPDQVIDATRLQVYRILTLGITGSDSPIANTSIPEAAVSLANINVVTNSLFGEKQSGNSAELHKKIEEAINFCKLNSDFDSFDRAHFITLYLNPISNLLHTCQREHNIQNVVRNRALNADAAFIFAEGAFDVNAFIPAPEYAFNENKAELGKMLFYDSSLSSDNTRSCATCHNPEKAFTDGLTVNTSLTGSNLKRNTPTLAYAALQHGQFWDMRQPDLEKQSVDVIQNRDEMHGNMDGILKTVSQNTTYKTLFKKAFKKNNIEPWQVQNALASYIRTMTKFNSRFDKYMRGNTTALNTEEIRGMNLFMGRAKCATCHFVPLFNGTVPPNFTKTEHEVLGTPQKAGSSERSTDPGRYEQNQLPQLLGAFKTPTLRNVALTAPYMHNGVYKTLEEVMDFYNKGGGYGIGVKADNQTLPIDKLGLSQAEIKAIIAFMKTLNDE